MRILLISNFRESIGGISVQVGLLNNHLNRDGFQSIIFSTYGNIFKRIFLFIKLLFVSQKFDVLHIHACSYKGFLPIVFGVFAGRINRKRIIITYHGGDADKFLRKNFNYVKWFFNQANHIIVLSGFLKEIFDKYGIISTIIPNVVALSKSQTIERKDISPNFISIRHLSPLYNIQLILQAFKNVKEEYPNATLVVLGDGPSRLELENWVKNQNLSDVTFVGQVQSSTIYDYLNNADIMISAPLTDNMPLSLLEAMNAGLLVISSNVGGVPYMIESNVSGYLFQSNNTKDLTDKMISAIKYPSKTLEMIHNAKTSLPRYQWTNIKPMLLNLYTN